MRRDWAIWRKQFYGICICICICICTVLVKETVLCYMYMYVFHNFSSWNASNFTLILVSHYPWRKWLHQKKHQSTNIAKERKHPQVNEKEKSIIISGFDRAFLQRSSYCSVSHQCLLGICKTHFYQYLWFTFDVL